MVPEIQGFNVLGLQSFRILEWRAGPALGPGAYTEAQASREEWRKGLRGERDELRSERRQRDQAR